MKKLLLIFLTMFLFVSCNSQMKTDKEIYAEYYKTNKWTKEMLIGIAKNHLKEIKDEDYKIIKFYHVNGMTKPTFRDDGTPYTFYIYLERKGKIIVCKYYKTDYGDEKESIEITGKYNEPLKKQLDLN